MNCKTICFLATMLFAAVCPAGPSTGADIGDPGDPGLVKKVRIALIHENYDRDVKLSEVRFTATGPDGFVPSVFRRESGSQEEARVMARVGFPVGDKALFHLDGGITDHDGSENPVAMFGAGIQVLAYESEAIDAAFFGSVHYVPEIEYTLSGFHVDLGRVAFTQEESYWEANGGVSLSHTFPLKQGTALIPYGGIVVSVLQGHEVFEIAYPEAGITEKGRGDLEEDGVLSVFAGLAFVFGEELSIHVEGRFVNQTTVSVGVVLNL